MAGRSMSRSCSSPWGARTAGCPLLGLGPVVTRRPVRGTSCLPVNPSPRPPPMIPLATPRRNPSPTISRPRRRTLEILSRSGGLTRMRMDAKRLMKAQEEGRRAMAAGHGPASPVVGRPHSYPATSCGSCSLDMDGRTSIVWSRDGRRGVPGRVRPISGRRRAGCPGLPPARARRQAVKLGLESGLRPADRRGRG